MKVTAFEVNNRPVNPAFGYRIDYAGHSVVLSGDTRVCKTSSDTQAGVDLLVHEVFAPGTLKRMGVSAERARSIIAYHLTPEEAGQNIWGTKPRLAVCRALGPNATDEELPFADAEDLYGALKLERI